MQTTQTNDTTQQNAGKRYTLGWERAPLCEDGTTTHSFGPERRIGNCLHERTCAACGVTEVQDSSD